MCITLKFYFDRGSIYDLIYEIGTDRAAGMDWALMIKNAYLSILRDSHLEIQSETELENNSEERLYCWRIEKEIETNSSYFYSNGTVLWFFLSPTYSIC